MSARRTNRTVLSRRFNREIRPLQDAVRDLGTQRGAILRIFVMSRKVTTADAQLEHWLEFTWLDQEYRVALQRLAHFCASHEQLPDSARVPGSLVAQDRSPAGPAHGTSERAAPLSP